MMCIHFIYFQTLTLLVIISNISTKYVAKGRPNRCEDPGQNSRFLHNDNLFHYATFSSSNISLSLTPTSRTCLLDRGGTRLFAGRSFIVAIE